MMDQKEFFVLAYRRGFTDSRSLGGLDEETAWEEFQKRYSDEMFETSVWLKRQIDHAYERGRKEGSESATRAFESSQKTHYEG
jgi:hypothetical protein